MYEILQELATKKGITIAELERKAGLSNGSVSKYKKGVPTITAFIKLADALEISAPTLLRRYMNEQENAHTHS